MPTRMLTTSDGRRIPDPRGTQAWRKLAKQVALEEPVCWLQFPKVCTQASTTGDHVIPVVDAPELALVRANVHGACSPCNTARRNMPIESLRLGSEAERPAALSVFD